MTMELGVYAVFGIAVIVAVAYFSKRLGVAAPIILVIVGVGLSFLPGVPVHRGAAELVLDGVLPPILYAAAISVPVVDFRRNFGTITSLSVVLVIVTAFGTGFLLFTMLPDLNLAAAIALGAIISPPDAVAATSIGRRLGLPPRILTVLEGEGLVNDATALVLLRSATAAAAGGLLTPWATIGDFLYAVFVAIVDRPAGRLRLGVRAHQAQRPGARHRDLVRRAVRGVHAHRGARRLRRAGRGRRRPLHRAPRPARSRAQARISDRINWRTIQFLLENGVFLLIGLEIRTLINDVENPEVLSVWDAIGLGLIASSR